MPRGRGKLGGEAAMGEFDFTGELEKLGDWKMPEMRGGAQVDIITSK